MNLNDKVVLVTGGNGFLGQHVVRVLLGRGAHPVVYSSTQYNLCDDRDVTEMFTNYPKPNAVIHLAAKVGGIGANQKAPAAFLYNNLRMGLNVIKASKDLGIEKFLLVGTVCSYPKFTPVPFKEESLWDGFPEETNAPYGVAKKTLGLLLQAARQQSNFNGVYVIPVNLYGPGDSIDLAMNHVIPAMMRKMLEAKANKQEFVVLWGDGTPTREFLYVKDAAEGIVRALEKLETSDPVNLGSGREISMKELAEVIQRVTGYTGNLVWDPSKPNGQPRRRLDTTKAEKLLDWKSSTKLEDGLRETLNDIASRLGISVEESSHFRSDGSGRLVSN